MIHRKENTPVSIAAHLMDALVADTADLPLTATQLDTYLRCLQLLLNATNREEKEKAKQIFAAPGFCVPTKRGFLRPAYSVYRWSVPMLFCYSFLNNTLLQCSDLPWYKTRLDFNKVHLVHKYAATHLPLLLVSFATTIG